MSCIRKFLASSTSSCSTTPARVAGREAAADRPPDLRDEDGPAVELHRRRPQAYPGRRRAGLRLFAPDDVRLPSEHPLCPVGLAGIAPIVAPDAGRADVGHGADEDDIQRVALHRPAGIGRTTRQPLERRAQRIEVVVVGDLRLRMLERERRRPVVVVRMQEQRERNQRLAAEQIDVDQRRPALWVDEDDSRVRRAGRDRIIEREFLDVVVDARIRCSCERLVHGPRHFQRREVVRVGSRPQQPQRLRRPVLDFDPDGHHVRLFDVGAEHLLAGFLAHDDRTDAHVVPVRRRGRGACAQCGVVDPGGDLPGRAAGQRERQRRMREDTTAVATVHSRRRAPLWRQARLRMSSPRNSISARDVGARSNTSTRRSPSV